MFILSSLLFSSSWFILVLAAIWDYIIGDPRSWIHPVQVMGWIVQNYTQLVIKQISNRLLRRLAGMVLGLGLIFGSATVGWLIVKITTQINLGLGTIMQILLLASCFAGKSLRIAAENVLQPLEEADLKTARSKLSMYVGRDTDHLSKIARKISL